MKHHPSREILKDLVIRQELKGFSVTIDFMNIDLNLNPLMKNENINLKNVGISSNNQILGFLYHTVAMPTVLSFINKKLKV